MKSSLVVFPTGIPKGPLFFLPQNKDGVSDSTTDHPKLRYDGSPLPKRRARFRANLSSYLRESGPGGSTRVRVGLAWGSAPLANFGKIHSVVVPSRPVPSRSLPDADDVLHVASGVSRCCAHCCAHYCALASCCCSSWC